ncbi:MAG: glutamine-hydrolyzing GMP synthase [Candidatus Diapherotrites archaeon]
MIVVLDFGSQYTHLIARKIRELGVRAEIMPFSSPIRRIQQASPAGIILSGGPKSVNEAKYLYCNKKIFYFGIPILGICYGHQLIAKEFKGKVRKGKAKEYGREIIELKEGKIFKGLAKKQVVWLSHGDTVIKVPEGFSAIASTANCPVSAMCNESKNIYSLQFHPEVHHTPNGKIILKNFAFRICKAGKDWNLTGIAKNLIEKTRKEIGNRKALIAVSGGVDSLVAATIANNAIKDNLFCFSVDNGLLRKNEVEYVKNLYEKKLKFKHFFLVDAEKEFLEALKGVEDPEEKRKIIGRKFIEVFERKALELEKRFGKIDFLIQGTIYPDRIESAVASRIAAKIKSHHNLMLPEKMKLTVFEPLKELYKDEVREIGLQLKIPREFLFRHPFPGPGLGVRVLGEITKEKLDLLREVDHIFIEELKKQNLYDKIWQAFAVLLPAKSVGVMGDERTYNYIVSLRAVNSVDGMTADWSKIPLDALEKISSRIVNEVKGVNRVLYDVTQKPPATIEYE